MKKKKKKVLQIRKCPKLPLDAYGVKVDGHRGKLMIAFTNRLPAYDGHW